MSFLKSHKCDVQMCKCENVQIHEIYRAKEFAHLQIRTLIPAYAE